MTGDTLLKLSKAFNISYNSLQGEQLTGAKDNENNIFPEALLHGTAAKLQNYLQSLDVVEIPLLGTVPAGFPDLRTQSDPLEYIPIPKEVLGNVPVEQVFGLKVSGNSLIGDNIHDGQVVLCKKDAPLINGKIYVLRFLQDNTVVARHVIKENSHIRLYASHSDYKDILDTDVQIIGMAFAYGN